MQFCAYGLIHQLNKWHLVILYKVQVQNKTVPLQRSIPCTALDCPICVGCAPQIRLYVGARESFNDLKLLVHSNWLIVIMPQRRVHCRHMVVCLCVIPSCRWFVMQFVRSCIFISSKLLSAESWPTC